MNNNFKLLNEILNPSRYDYELSEKLFLDIWEQWGNPQEINDGSDIYKFLSNVIDKSNGYVILDHFSHINYDRIHCIKYEEPYTLIYWQDNNKYREKYLSKTLTEDEALMWQAYGLCTYSYMLFHIKKIKFVKLNNHMFILFLLNLIPDKKIQQIILKGNQLISKVGNSNELYTDYVFWEGDKQNAIKHNCTVNNLPYYTCLIQPKEGSGSTGVSRKILLLATLNEIKVRMEKVYNSLIILDDYDYDEILSKGNTIRRIMEYALKYFCIHRSIGLKIDDKYGHIMLGYLRNEINEKCDDLNISKQLIKMANDLSHDSGKVFGKNDVVKFWKDANQLLEEIKTLYKDL